jgi:O-acetyl-ADP-ribose deacetylase
MQTEDSKKVREYPADLSSKEKSNIEAIFIDDNTLKIGFQQLPTLSVTIRRQNIFTSGAQVIVNAANVHLGGGGGIDGAIHAKGGKDYAEAHRELQKEYHAEYVSGHAAMIDSGGLKEAYKIENVIVVAGPQGASNSDKESQLYSCYYNSLVLAQDQGKSSVAFPSISTGIFGFPKDRAASISLKAISDFIRNNPNTTLKNISIHFLPSEPKTYLETYQKAAT